MSNLKWKRNENGVYAESKNENLRYYAIRENRKWMLEVVRTVEVSGIRVVPEPGNACVVDFDAYHDTLALTKAVAEAYDAEPIHSGPMNRLTRAISRGYEAAK